MDYNFWLRFARKHRFHVLDRTLAAFRIVPTTKTGGHAGPDVCGGIRREPGVLAPVALAAFCGFA